VLNLSSGGEAGPWTSLLGTAGHRGGEGVDGYPSTLGITPAYSACSHEGPFGYTCYCPGERQLYVGTHTHTYTQYINDLLSTSFSRYRYYYCCQGMPACLDFSSCHTLKNILSLTHTLIQALTFHIFLFSNHTHTNARSHHTRL